jgi:hypothetical protein
MLQEVIEYLQWELATFEEEHPKSDWQVGYEHALLDDKGSGSQA